MNADAVLSRLYRDREAYVSGQALAGELGVTRAAVWKSVEALRADGYEVESVRAKGYRLASMPDRLGGREVMLGLDTDTLGRQVVALEEVDSTNTLAARLAEEGAPDGTLVVAEHQSAGRGRLGRAWVSPPGMNIYMSVVLRPEVPPNKAPLVTLAASVALVRSVRELYGLPATIKWPNDMLIGGRKSAGILTEMSAEPQRVRHVVLGIGVDANMPKGAFPADIRDVSTSIMLELGRKVHRAELVWRLLSELERVYGMLKADERAAILEEWRGLTDMLGQRVCVTTLAGEIRGTAKDVDEDGFLVVERPGGKAERITSGDVGFV